MNLLLHPLDNFFPLHPHHLLNLGMILIPKFLNDLKQTILSSPILICSDSSKRFYLKTDFSSFGFGYALCQPANDDDSMATMK